MTEPGAVLDMRARALAQPLPGADPPGMLDLLVVRTGAQSVAFDSARVREVLAPGAITPVPGAAPALLGMRAVRGELLAVAALGDVAGMSTTSSGGWVVVLDDGSAPVGLAVDGVEGVLRAAATSVKGDPEGHQAAGLLLGTTDSGVLVLDADAVLTDGRLWAAPQTAAGAHGDGSAEPGHEAEADT